MAITLHNKGQRTIIHENHEFKPGTSGSFTEAAAEKLRRLYPLEVASLEDTVKVFEDAPKSAAKGKGVKTDKADVIEGAQGSDDKTNA